MSKHEFQFLCFLWNKIIFKALSLWQVSSKIVFFQFFSVFLKSRNDFQRRGRIFELVLNHTHHKNTPNSTWTTLQTDRFRTCEISGKWFSKAFTEKILFCKHFPVFLMWYCRCVIGSKRVKNKNIRNCFQRVFVLQDVFIFRKIMIFMWNCTRCFKIFYICVFEKTHLGIRIDANTVFTFLFFLGIPLKTQRSMMKKTGKTGVSRFLSIFRHSKTTSRISHSRS